MANIQQVYQVRQGELRHCPSQGQPSQPPGSQAQGLGDFLEHCVGQAAQQACSSCSPAATGDAAVVPKTVAPSVAARWLQVKAAVLVARLRSLIA